MAITRVHHLNCGSMCPLAPAVGAPGGWRERGLLVCHCLLLETDGDGLILVETGFGTPEVEQPRKLPAPFRTLAAPALDPAETAIAQIRALGFDPADVRHIAITHLDVDHAGGLVDFPHARVHLHGRERDAAVLGNTLVDRVRYLRYQLAHGPRWQTYRDAGDRWFGFESVGPLEGVGEDVALIPLFGHSRGHSGVAVRTAGGWLLHAGDAFFHADELADRMACPLGLRIFQRIDDVDHRTRVANADRLRALHRDHGGEVDIFCAHDAGQLAARAG